jgi:Tfp pilus assembly protein PilF
VAFYNRGLLRLDKGDKDQAIADLKKALKIDHSFSRAYQVLSKLLLPKSKHPTNKDVKVKVLALDKKCPTNPAVE